MFLISCTNFVGVFVFEKSLCSSAIYHEFCPFVVVVAAAAATATAIVGILIQGLIKHRVISNLLSNSS